MAGTTGSIRPKDPRAGITPPRHFVQFLDPAGRERLPARDFEARAANQLLKEKEMRFYSDALDRIWRVEMSRATITEDPNGAAICQFFLGNHCIHTSTPFVFSVRNTWFSASFRSVTGRDQPSDTAWGRGFGNPLAEAASGNLCRGQLHPSAYVGRNAQPSAPGLALSTQSSTCIAKWSRLRWIGALSPVSVDAQVPFMTSQPIKEETVPKDASED